MDQVHVVRHKVLREGLSQRQVATQMGLSRNTVGKYVNETPPQRAPYPARAKPVFDLVASRLEALYEEWSARTTRKQRITGDRLLRQLREEGFEVGRTTVGDWLREKRRTTAEVFIPLVYAPGDVAQFDFFEVVVEVDGHRRKAWKFVARLMHSGSDFVWLYDRCDQVAFFDGHVRAFEAFGGVMARGVYDNLSPAVRFHLGLDGTPERRLSDRFAALASHYVFEPCFTRIGQGHDKGGVESRGKAIRYQHLTPIPQGKTLTEIAEAVWADVQSQARERRDAQGRTAHDRLEAERPSLRRLPPTPFDPRRFVPVTVSSKSTIQIDGATYSVPCEWVRLDASAYVGVDDIRVICLGQVRIFERVPRGQRQIRYRDYVPELARKPQAVRQVAPELLAELGGPWPELWDLLVAAHGARESSRVLARLLGVMARVGEDEVSAAVSAALAAERPNLQVLRALLDADDEPARVEVPAALAGYEIASARASDYDWLMKGGER